MATVSLDLVHGEEDDITWLLEGNGGTAKSCNRAAEPSFVLLIPFDRMSAFCVAIAGSRQIQS